MHSSPAPARATAARPVRVYLGMTPMLLDQKRGYKRKKKGSFCSTDHVVRAKTLTWTWFKKASSWTRFPSPTASKSTFRPSPTFLLAASTSGWAVRATVGISSRFWHRSSACSSSVMRRCSTDTPESSCVRRRRRLKERWCGAVRYGWIKSIEIAARAKGLALDACSGSVHREHASTFVQHRHLCGKHL